MNSFNCSAYLEKQIEGIKKRINDFGGKLYLEFGGKLVDDYHAQRILPGFQKDIKLKMLQRMSDDLEIIICIFSKDIENSKVRGDYGLLYEEMLLKNIKFFKDNNLKVNSVVITRFDNELKSIKFKQKLESLNIDVHLHSSIIGYPENLDIVLSDEGFSKNSFIKTTKPLVVVTAPGALCGKLSTCLSQIYHEYKNGKSCGYVKYETFPVWNLPLNHPVNEAYEAATTDLRDVNMIDPFHLKEYKVSSVNYNRDIEAFPILKNMLDKIMNKSIYKSPTDMGVNNLALFITNDENVKKSSRLEIIRRYLKAKVDYENGLCNKDTLNLNKNILLRNDISLDERIIIKKAKEKALLSNSISSACLINNNIILSRTTNILTAPASLILNVLKYFANIEDNVFLVKEEVLTPMIEFKKKLNDDDNTKLSLNDVLMCLSIYEKTDKSIKKALSFLENLQYIDVHFSSIINFDDQKTLKQLHIDFTMDI
ncbi:MAG: DUF1846 domain-containing protein [Bacilli bacterium]